MEKKSILTMVFVSLCVLAFFIFWPTKSNNDKTAELKVEALGIVKKFGGTLKPRLKEALKDGGPINAIEVCSKEAPAIAQKLSSETGWKVKRVSLKPRNGKTALPDAWERKGLEQFNERQSQGESAEKMAFAEIIDGRFRFLKAQGVEEICLTCHGKTVISGIKNALKRNYPNDAATGYSLGQIRGAFSLSKEL